MNNILRVFTDTDMRCQHPGLKKVAAKQRVLLDNLTAGEHVIFINTACDRMKMYSSGGVLSYIKTEGRIDMRYISAFPKAFNASGKFEYDLAVKEVLEKKLGKVVRMQKVGGQNEIRV